MTITVVRQPVRLTEWVRSTEVKKVETPKIDLKPVQL